MTNLAEQLRSLYPLARVGRAASYEALLAAADEIDRLTAIVNDYRTAEIARTAPEPELIPVRKVGPGAYLTDQDHQINWYPSNRHAGTMAGWYIVFPGETTADVRRDTLRECREYLSQEGTQP